MHWNISSTTTMTAMGLFRFSSSRVKLLTAMGLFRFSNQMVRLALAKEHETPICHYGPDEYIYIEGNNSITAPLNFVGEVIQFCWFLPCLLPTVPSEQHWQCASRSYSCLHISSTSIYRWNDSSRIHFGENKFSFMDIFNLGIRVPFNTKKMVLCLKSSVSTQD